MRTAPLGEQKREPAAHWKVVCEGHSELIYIDQLGGKIHGTTYKAYNAKGGDLTNIRQETENRSKQGQTIVIMDVDNNDIEEIRRFRKWCEGKKIKLLISNPSFEVWLLMHYQNVSPSMDQYGLEHALDRYVTRGRYEKSKGIRVNKALIDGAVERA